MDIVQTAVFEFCQHIKPELCPLVFGQLHARQFFLAFEVVIQAPYTSDSIAIKY